MITLGLDPHPGSHTVVALSLNGASLASIKVPNTPDGLAQLHEFARQFPSHRWAVEGAGNHFIAVFVDELLKREEMVYSIPASLTSQYRARRGRKKNDVVDAENVGRALIANPQLPVFQTMEQQRELQELTRTQRRLAEQLKANRAAMRELAPQSPVRDVLQQIITALMQQLVLLEKRIRTRVSNLMPWLLKLPGVGPIIAGVLLAETGNPKRFASPDHFASYCGAAPVERGSGQNSRMQINPGGNRRLNWALHIVAMVRLRVDGGRSRRLFDKAQLRGKTKRSALRLLKTYIARELFRNLQRTSPLLTTSGGKLIGQKL
jgi:transposase